MRERSSSSLTSGRAFSSRAISSRRFLVSRLSQVISSSNPDNFKSETRPFMKEKIRRVLSSTFFAIDMFFPFTSCTCNDRSLSTVRCNLRRCAFSTTVFTFITILSSDFDVLAFWACIRREFKSSLFKKDTRSFPSSLRINSVTPRLSSSVFSYFSTVFSKERIRAFRLRIVLSGSACGAIPSRKRIFSPLPDAAAELSPT